jgi:hypothetical protein
MIHYGGRILSGFGVRRPVGALVAGDLSAAASRQVATDESGDRSPHSKRREHLQGKPDRS